MAKYAKINPVPFLFAQFFAANILSTFLYIENPTNIIVAQAFQISFVAFFLWMCLPTIVGGLSAFLMLWLYFRKQIPQKINPSDLEPRLALRDASGAIYITIVLGICLALLSVIIEFGWLVTFICALACLIRDFGHDIYMHHKVWRKQPRARFLRSMRQKWVQTWHQKWKKSACSPVFTVSGVICPGR